MTALSMSIGAQNLPSLPPQLAAMEKPRQGRIAPFQPRSHPLPTGHIFTSPGAHLTYRIVGPCCRLYDRDQLPWPCCRIQWRSKEPSWRRIGRRFTVDLSTRKHPSYCVEIIGQSYRSEPIVMTLYTVKLSAQQQDWWHTKRLQQVTADSPSVDQSS